MRETAEYTVTLCSADATAYEPTWYFPLNEPDIQVQGDPSASSSLTVVSDRLVSSGGGVLVTQATVMSPEEWERQRKIEIALEETNRLYGGMLQSLSEY